MSYNFVNWLVILAGLRATGLQSCCCSGDVHVAMLQRSVAHVVVQTEEGGMANRPHTVDAAWALDGARTPAAAPLVRPRGPQGRHRANARPSLHLFPFSIPLCASGWKQGRCHCRELHRRRAHSPPHHRPPNLVPSSITTPSTSPFPPGSPLGCR
jgi:hypothetical protein